ncbi:hypothetical protein C2E23DRAFT_723429 [Lenzites betulinus]|nr:hypothetical protein C2E23DRAFT_723429 [Lenzites betulinus]
MPPTHPALLLPDIINEIFPYIRIQTDAEASDGRSWASLANAARVCKAFYGPATRALWWGIPGIEPVLRMLVRFSLLSVTRNVEGSNITRAYVRTVSSQTPRKADVCAEDWESLRRCTAYTRVIFHGSRQYRASADVYVYLSYKSNARPLFPNVRSLTWYAEAPDHLGLVPLVNPDLRRLKIILGTEELDRIRPVVDGWAVLHHDQNPPEGPSLDQLLQTTLPRMKGLVDLEIRASSQIPYMQEWISWTHVGRLEHLRTLILAQSCVVRHAHLLRDLAALPCLAELSLRLAREESDASLDFSGFLALEKLALDIIRDPSLEILSAFISPRLHTLSARFERARQDTIPTILNHAALAYPCIRSITVKDFSGQSFPDGSHVPTFQAAFRRIAQNAAIEELVLQTSRPLFICIGGDVELAHLAKSWPRLHTFSFLTAMFGEQRVTHRAVLAFARHCPELRTLHLRGVEMDDLTKEEMKALPLSAHGLTELGLCAARAGYVRRCARFLCKVFPQMKVPTTVAWRCPSCTSNTHYFGCTRPLDNIFQLHQVPGKKRAARKGPALASSTHDYTGFVAAP